MTTLFGSLAIIIVLAGILWFVRKAGKDAVKADIGEQNAKAAERIAKAVGDAPRTKSDVVGRLQQRGRKL